MRFRTLSALLLGFALGGCSAASYRTSADEEAYEIVAERRKELGTASRPFTIDVAAQTLRTELESAAAASKPAAKTLDLRQALLVAAENSRDYQRRKEQVYLAALDLALEKYRFGFIPSVTGAGNVNGTAETATDTDASITGGVTRLLGSGARIVSSIGVGLFRSLLTSEGWRTLPSSLALSVTQPLMRGFGSSIVREPLTQAERNVLYEVRNFERFRQEFAVDVATRYYRVLQDANVIDNEKTNYENLKLVRERNEGLQAAGRLSDVEVGQARQNELSARNRWIVAQQSYASRLDEFKIFLGLPTSAQIGLADDELKKLASDGMLAVEVKEELSYATALERRFDYHTARDRVVDATRKVKIAEDALRAGLGVTGAYNITSNEGQPSNFQGSDAPWSVGLDLDLPVYRLPERNAYRSSLITLEVEKRAESLSRDNIRLDIRNSLRTLGQTRESYEIQQTAVGLAERRVEGATLTLQAGRASTRDLLESQEALVQARNALTRNLVDYTLARLTLFSDLGALVLDEDGIRGDAEALRQARGEVAAADTP